MDKVTMKALLANAADDAGEEAPSELTRMLQERGHTHGSLLDQAAMAETLQRAAHMSPQWLGKGVVTRYTLNMILIKISRIIEGDETFADHWDDIIGYAEKGKEYAGQGGPAQDYTGGRKAAGTNNKG